MECHRQRQRGMVFITMALWLAAFLGLAVIGIDVGRVAFTANEVHTVADVAATAGALALFKGQDAVTNAQTVAAQNRIDARTASIPASEITIWHYDTTTGTIPCVLGLPGPTACNAVRAHVNSTVNNVMAAVVGRPTSTVDRISTAAYKTLGAATPGPLPVALGDCYFQTPCYSDGCLPPLIQIPSNTTGLANDTAWTAYFISNPNSNNVNSYIPTICGGSGATPPEISAGQNINVNNGDIANIYSKIQCMLDHGMNTFLIPIFHSSATTCGGPLNQSQQVVGFATIVVDAVFGPPNNPKHIDVHAVFRSDVPGGFGGSCPYCGTGSIALIN
jgi:hypothetical protein